MPSAPVFPNYTQIPQPIPIKVWHALRVLSVLTALLICVLLVVSPKTGLTLFWGIFIPLLPLVFFFAPGLWRNTCPLAALNQTPRLFRFTRGLAQPDWLKQYAYVIGIALFLIIVPARKALFNQSGLATAGLILAALVVAFLGGLVFRGKSGWCSSICPLLPVQRIYGQTPFALIPNSHCQPCVGCAKNCYDFNPRVAYLADLNDDDPHYVAYRGFFAGAFPGLILAFFTVPDPPAISVLELYLRFAAYVLAGAGSFYALTSFAKASTHKITTLYAVAALNLFYFFVIPRVLTTLGLELPDIVIWTLRLALLAVTAEWIARTYRKEPLFIAQALAAAAPRVGASATQALQRAAGSGKPEVTFTPGDRRLPVEAGRSLLEIIEANGMRIESGCRMGVCGADPVGILGGMDHLTPAGEDERGTLERLGLDESTRMACCARVRGDCAVSLTPGKAKELAPASTFIVPIRYDNAIERVVVIGNGIAGVTAADYLRRRHPKCQIHLVARENHNLYNRMGIERLIYGRSAMQGLYLLPEPWYEEHLITVWLNTQAVKIDRDQRRVLLGIGEALPYDRVILAMGSASMVPPIDGFGQPGSFVLREAEDAMRIRAFAQQNGARRAVVAGAGLLGLEAAHALIRLGLQVTVLERSDRLLRRQLDARAGEFLRGYLEGLGMEILLQADTVSVQGNSRVQQVLLKDGRSVPCDLFLVAAGITPNVDLARDAGLAVKRGVIVDAFMRTSDEHIFAAGDVAELDGEVQGLWPTAVAQAKVAALNAVGGNRVHEGFVPVTILKVAGIDLTSIGRIAADGQNELEIVLEDSREHKYRKLVIAEGTIAGAILLGYPLEVAAVREVAAKHVDVRPHLDALRAGNWNVLADLESEQVHNGSS